MKTKNVEALMAEAMEQMQDPEVMREVRKLMQDPSFAAQVSEPTQPTAA